MRDDFRLWYPIDVRWGDMDAFGHVNNARYFTYCESARIAYFDAIRLDELKAAPDHGPAVVSATCNFRRQVHYPDALDVGARTSRIGGKSFTLEYEIFRRGTDDRVADGSSVVVWVDYGAGKSLPLPDALLARLRDFDGVEP
ncbi:MAG: thioesterase family protein [Acidobacteriota bacterium]